MKKVFFSPVLITLFLIFEFIFLSNCIYLMIEGDYTFIFLLIMSIILILIYIFAFSIVFFSNKIYILKKMKIIVLNYSEIKKVKVSYSITHALLVGALFKLEIISNNGMEYKCDIGQIIMIKSAINKIKSIMKYNDIKIDIYEKD